MSKHEKFTETSNPISMILIFEQKHTIGVHVFRKMEAKRKKGRDINKFKLCNIKRNDYEKKLVFIFTIILTGTLNSQDNSSVVEITTKDITLYPNLKSDKINVFGIHIGMTQFDVYKILSENSQLYYLIDKEHATTDFRIYVYDINKDNEKRNCILYLIWTDNSNELSEITFFEDFSPYLVGSTSKLLTFEGFDFQSKLFQDYLGYPNKTKIALDIPSIGLKHTTYCYYSKGIEITIKESSGGKTAVFAFVKT
jgi:hypothetical protein